MQSAHLCTVLLQKDSMQRLVHQKVMLHDRSHVFDLLLVLKMILMMFMCFLLPPSLFF